MSPRSFLKPVIGLLLLGAVLGLRLWPLVVFGVLVLAVIALIPRVGRATLTRVGWARVPAVGGLTGIAAALSLGGIAFASAIVASAIAPLPSPSSRPDAPTAVAPVAARAVTTGPARTTPTERPTTAPPVRTTSAPSALAANAAATQTARPTPTPSAATTSPETPAPTPVITPVPTRLPTTTPAPVIATLVPAPAPAGGFDPSFYIGKGDAFNCSSFASQAQAQAVLRADPNDPNRLDTDRDGIACESNGAPKDLVPVVRR